MPTFDFRHKLSLRDTLPAVGAGLSAGAAVFYLARLLIERTPLVASAEIADGTSAERPPLPAPKVGRVPRV